MRITKLFRILLWGSLPCLLVGQTVTTQHNDTFRTGANTAETILNTSNVNVGTFGKIFSRTVDGQIYAQPLYLSKVSIPGKGVHNVVYVATENNSVYAFDADDPGQSAPLWQVTLGTPVLQANIPFGSTDLLPAIGISSTPVIDIPSGTMYVVSSTAPAPAFTVSYKLHALDITTGAEKFRGPVVIQGSVPGNGFASINGVLTFDPTIHGQRTGLLLQNGSVYFGFSSHGGDGPYHGWLFSYDQKSLRQTGIQNFSPNGIGAAAWQGLAGLAGDGSSIYVVTGNGDLNPAIGNYGSSVVKMSELGSLAITDYFTPNDWSTTNPVDGDFGSGGALLIPGTSLLAAAGKPGNVYVLNTNSLGQYDLTANQVVQQWSVQGPQFGGMVFYNSTLYIAPGGQYIELFPFNGAGATPVFGNTDNPTIWNLQQPLAGYKNVPAMSISANGTTSGSAVLWASYVPSGVVDGSSTPGVLQAFDARNLQLLWSSDQAQSNRDASGGPVKWNPPTVVNGKVYLPTMDGVLNVYGLLPQN